MERGFKYRIYPNASQRDQIARTLGCCRFVYNRALDVKKSAYAKTGKTVSWAELSRMLPARNILAEGKRILSNTEGTAGHAGTVAATVA